MSPNHAKLTAKNNAKQMQFMSKYRHIGFGTIIILFLSANPARAQDRTWHIPAASVRFEVQITARPSIPVSGIIAILPDGGILPQGKIKATAVDSAGKPLPANLLWHNPEEGLALVFEDTPAAQAWVYIESAKEYPPASAPLCPSLMLFVRNGGQPSLEQARALGAKMPSGANTYFALVENIFHSVLPVGLDENTSAYYAGWIKVQRPGKTYFYTVSKDGSEFAIDGKLAYSWPGMHGVKGGTRAEKGTWLDLGAGTHKIEYFHFTKTAVDRECLLGWQQAGETQPKNPKHPEYFNLRVTKPLETYDFTHSGVAELKSAFSKQGPLAVINAKWSAFFQPGNSPTCLFDFDAFGADSLPPGTIYEWDFGNGRKLKGPQASWLAGGMDGQRVTLHLTVAKNKSTCSKLFFAKLKTPREQTQRLSINSAKDRRKIRELFLGMCRATPTGKRPGEFWNATLWEALVAAVEPQGDYALLRELFDRSRPDILKLDTKKRQYLEDAFFVALRQADPQAAITWLDRLAQEETDPTRIGHWQARRVEFYIFEAAKLDQARLAASAFAGTATNSNLKNLAMVRMGDVELFDGHPDLARRFYGQVQELHQRPDNPGANQAGARPELKKTPPPAAAKPPEVNLAFFNDQKSVRPPPGAAAKKNTRPPAAPQMADAIPPVIDQWKIEAVRASSFYTTVRSLISQRAYVEARAKLDQWELESPLDKLAGDFSLAEADYYQALRQFARAHKILKNYRQSVDLSNTLPQAMKMELECLVRLDRDAEARDLAAEIIKRLPKHPLAEEIKALLARSAGGKLIIPENDQPQDWTASEKVDTASLADLFSTNKLIWVDAEDQAAGPGTPVNAAEPDANENHAPNRGAGQGLTGFGPHRLGAAEQN